MKNELQAFDEFLADRSLSFESIVIGGAALILMDVTSRRTRDVDCLDPAIPEEIQKAAEEFARVRSALRLDPHWLNNGPESLKRELPEGWRLRVRPLYKGRALTLFTLGRSDLLRSKLFAYCDRGDDLRDCLALQPTIDELDECFPWVAARDTNPLWPDHVETAFAELKKRLGHAG